MKAGKPNPFDRSGTDATVIEARRAKVAELSLDGFTQAEIAEQLDVSQTTISRDLKQVREEWKQERIEQFGVYLDVEYKKTLHAERLALRAFRESRGKIVKTTRTKGGPNGDTLTRVVEYSAGDPRFLQVYGQCIDRRVKLLGIAPPERLEIVDDGPMTYEKAEKTIRHYVNLMGQRIDFEESEDDTDAELN